MAWERVRTEFRAIGSGRPRRTFAQLALAALALLYIFLAFMVEPAWRPAFVTLALCYLLGFFAVGSEWFWGRWFAMGLGWSGFMMGAFSLVNVGVVAPLIVYTLLHGAMVAAMKSKAVAALYEGQTAWRDRYGLDEYGVGRVGKAVTRTSASLPALVVWALGPKEPASLGFFIHTSGLLVGLAFALALLGLVLILRLRSAGVLAVGAAGALCALALYTGSALAALGLSAAPEFVSVNVARWLASAALLAAALPFVLPMHRFLCGRD